MHTRPRTNYEFARQTLRAEILEGRLGPGTKLIQTELAARLDVSTTPVREALQDLAREGLVLLDPHRGAFVRELSLDEVRNDSPDPAVSIHVYRDQGRAMRPYHLDPLGGPVPS